MQKSLRRLSNQRRLTRNQKNHNRWQIATGGEGSSPPTGSKPAIASLKRQFYFMAAAVTEAGGLAWAR
jgi:hypothetical protein